MTKFSIQTGSSLVSWTGKKVLGLHTGTIGVKDDFFCFEQDNLIGGEVTIDMTTIVVTDIEDRKTHREFFEHLNNDDFFSINRYKTASLSISKGEKVNGLYVISGELTIKGITQPINFTAAVEIFSDFLLASGEINIDRTQYNIKYLSGKFLPNLGDKLIYDKFVLQFKLIGQKLNA